MPVLIGIRGQWFPWQKSSKHPDLPHDLYVNAASTEESVQQCVLAMPYSLKHLLAKEPWKAQSQKVWSDEILIIDCIYFFLLQSTDYCMCHAEYGTYPAY